MSAPGRRDQFKARVGEWAQKLEVSVRIISIRAMKNKWASYTKANDLVIFNSDLLEMEPEIQDYVIVHELLHFVTPNHGKLWKSLMRAHLGDYERIEMALKEISALTEIPGCGGIIDPKDS